eukprot:6422892-Amphidinium_carterae.1
MSHIPTPVDLFYVNFHESLAGDVSCPYFEPKDLEGFTRNFDLTREAHVCNCPNIACHRPGCTYLHVGVPLHGDPTGVDRLYKAKEDEPKFAKPPTP